MILVLDNNRNQFLWGSQRASLLSPLILMDEGERPLKEIFSPSHTEGGLRLVWTAWNLYNLLLVQLRSADSPLAAFYCFTLYQSHHLSLTFISARERQKDHMAGTMIQVLHQLCPAWSNPSQSAAH